MESTDDLSLDSGREPEAISKAKKAERARKKREYRLRRQRDASLGEFAPHFSSDQTPWALRVPY
jgi:hypothetical protein